MPVSGNLATGAIVDDSLKEILPCQARDLHNRTPQLGKAAGAVDILFPDIRRHTIRLILHEAEALINRMKAMLLRQFDNQIMRIKVLFSLKHRHRSHGAQEIIAYNVFLSPIPGIQSRDAALINSPSGSGLPINFPV